MAFESSEPSGVHSKFVLFPSAQAANTILDSGPKLSVNLTHLAPVNRAAWILSAAFSGCKSTKSF